MVYVESLGCVSMAGQVVRMCASWLVRYEIAVISCMSGILG